MSKSTNNPRLGYEDEMKLKYSLLEKISLRLDFELVLIVIDLFAKVISGNYAYID